MTVRAVFHLGIVTHWSKVICLPNDTYPTAQRISSKFASDTSRPRGVGVFCGSKAQQFIEVEKVGMLLI